MQSLIPSSLRAHGLLGGVICALNSGLQATAEEQHLVAKINKRQAPESFLPAPARQQEGMATGQHRAHPAVLPPAPIARERERERGEGEGHLPPTARSLFVVFPLIVSAMLLTLNLVDGGY